MFFALLVVAVVATIWVFGVKGVLTFFAYAIPVVAWVLFTGISLWTIFFNEKDIQPLDEDFSALQGGEDR